MTASIRVEGLSRTIGQLKKLGVESSDLKEAWIPVGRDVTNRARQEAPNDTGRLAGSIRPSKRQNGVTIRAGGARAPYAPYVYFGAVTQPGPRPFIDAALQYVDVDTAILRALDQAIRTSGLAP